MLKSGLICKLIQAQDALQTIQQKNNSCSMPEILIIIWQVFDSLTFSQILTR